MKYKHYAPKVKCVLVEDSDKQIEKINLLLNKNSNACVLGFEDDRDKIEVRNEFFISLGNRENLEEVSANIFSALRKLDKIENCSLGIIEGLKKEGLGLSIMNRLIRACENNVI